MNTAAFAPSSQTITRVPQKPQKFWILGGTLCSAPASVLMLAKRWCDSRSAPSFFAQPRTHTYTRRFAMRYAPHKRLQNSVSLPIHLNGIATIQSGETGEGARRFSPGADRHGKF